MSDSCFPVVFGTCLDAEAIWLGKSPENAAKPVLLSHGAFEVREGLAPVLDLFDAHRIRSTFFVPGITVDRYPEAVREIHRRGHEVASHGYGHLSPPLLSPERELEELVAGITAIERVAGVRPVTWRSPSWEFTEHTIDYLIEQAISVSTNFHDSTRPYRHQRAGIDLPLVELPVEWHLADAPYFLYAGQPGRQLYPPRVVEQMWRDDFDGLYQRPGSFFHLTLHVQLIGHPARLAMLDRLIGHIKAQPRSRFMRCDELASMIK